MLYHTLPFCGFCLGFWVEHHQCAALVKSKDDMARYYNQQWTPAPTFIAGEKVYLDASDISTMRPTKKFMHRYLGPFLIIRPVGTHTYWLKLPHSMSCIHPVFHVIKLMLVPPDPIIGGEERYEVEEVINSHFWHRKLQYLVKGYGHEENRGCWKVILMRQN